MSANVDTMHDLEGGDYMDKGAMTVCFYAGCTLRISHGRERIFMEENENDKKFWNVKELATYLGVSKSLIYARIEKAEIPAKRIGARILIPASFVKSLLTA